MVVVVVQVEAEEEEPGACLREGGEESITRHAWKYEISTHLPVE